MDVKKGDKEISNKYDVEICNLTKIYKLKGKNKQITALNNVTFKVKKGEIFGLLGPNGAGKTTLVSILATLVQPTSGYATILNHDVVKEPWYIKKNIGLMFGSEMIYYRLTGYKNLKFYCKLYGIKNYQEKIYEIADRFELKPWLNQYASSYSRGMKLKLALARILLTEPKILFLDEPLLGLDPKSVNELIEILLSLKKTIFLTSHQMDVVQKLCNRIAFLRKGQVIKIDNKENFLTLLKSEINIELNISDRKAELIKSLKGVDFISNINEKQEIIRFSIENESYFPNLFEILSHFPITQFKQKKHKLEDVFIKLSG